MVEYNFKDTSKTKQYSCINKSVKTSKKMQNLLSDKRLDFIVFLH